MRLNAKQRSYLIILLSFILVSIVYEIGYLLIKGQLDLSRTPFIVSGAFIASIIGILAAKNKDVS